MEESTYLIIWDGMILMSDLLVQLAFDDLASGSVAGFCIWASESIASDTRY